MIRIFITSVLVIRLVFSTCSIAISKDEVWALDTKIHTCFGPNDWIEDLQKFREALLTENKEIVKSYFVFPVSDPGNDIWFRVNSRLASSLDPNKTTPFKEVDFDKYYGELLGIDFKRTFEILDLDKLSTISPVQSTKIEIIPDSKSYMKASIDRINKVLTLEVIHEAKEFGKYTFKYHFRVLNNSTIKFKDMTFIM